LKIKIYKTSFSLFGLYGCETWSLTLREENSLKVFEIRVLRRIFGHHSPSPNAEVKDALSYTSTPQYVFMAWCLMYPRDNFTFKREGGKGTWRKLLNMRFNVYFLPNIRVIK
jgi:hypothetical protein